MRQLPRSVPQAAPRPYSPDRLRLLMTVGLGEPRKRIRGGKGRGRRIVGRMDDK